MVPELVLETTQVLLDITAKNAQELALQIRNIITHGMREVLNAREQERRQEVTPPVTRTRRTRSEGSDDDEGDDDDDVNSVGAGAAA